MAPERLAAEVDPHGWVDKVIQRNPDLLNVYLTRGNPYYGGDRVSVESKIKFLLWFAVVGKTAFPNICCFDKDYLTILNTRLASGRTLLEDYAGNAEQLARQAGTPLAEATGQAVACFKSRPDTITGIASTRLTELRLHGVSIVGFPLNTLGLGEDARSLFKVLRSLGVPVSLVDMGNDALERITEADAYEPYIFPRPMFPTVVFCMPLFELLSVKAEWGPGALSGRYVIGYCPWELTSIDPCWDHAYAAVDEFWASTRFLVDVYRSLTSRPVIHMPMLVDAGSPDLTVRRRYGLPEREFACLVMTDLNSTLKRKNAAGAVRAFQMAFPRADTGVRLFLKTTHLERRPGEWEALGKVIGDDERVIVIDGPLPRPELLGLIATSHVFLSLHRAEGFGRVLAEAMMLGTSVVATDWSGSRDIVDERTGYPVRCHTVPVKPEDYPEAAGVWAEPDLAQAAGIMRALRDQPAAAAARIAQGRQHVAGHFSLQVIARQVATRLADIRSLC